MMKVKDFINKAKEIEKLPTTYILGGSFCQKKVNGKLVTDCSGLIKGILWGYPNVKYASNNVPDINANTMIARCSNVTTDFTKAKPGWLLWMDGHIGIYIGEGLCIESSPRWENGVQITHVQGSGYTANGKNSRKWTKCGKFDKYIDYTEEVKEEKKEEVKKPTTKTFTSIVDYLDSKKIDSSFNNRKKLAEQYGISNYSGTASQNTKLLELMQKGAPAPVVTYYKKYTGSSKSLVEALNSLKIDSSFSNRKKIAAKNNIEGYKGTGPQNIKMLNLLKKGKLIK